MALKYISKRKSTILKVIGLTILSFAIISPITGYAGDYGYNNSLQGQGKNRNQGKNKAYSSKSKRTELPKVQSVGSNSLVVNGKKLEVDEDTAITVNGKEAEISAISKGMTAIVTSKIVEFGKTSKDSVYLATRISARNSGKNGKKGK